MMAVKKMLDNISVSDGRNKQRNKKSAAYKLWGIWCDETKRRDYDEINELAEECFMEHLESFSFNELAYSVRSAARMKPKKNDKHDVYRLVDSLDDINLENQARQLYESGKPAIEFTRSFAKILTTRYELAEILNDEEELWDEEDECKAEWLMTHLKPTDVKKLRADMESAGVWEDPMPVYHFFDLRRKRAWRKNIGSPAKKTSGKSGQNVYDQGAHESELVKQIDISVDPAADEYMEKYSISMALEFHLSAPENYWDDVAELMDKDGFSSSEAYNELEEKYDWHPDDRAD